MVLVVHMSGKEMCSNLSQKLLKEPDVLEKYIDFY